MTNIEMTISGQTIHLSDFHTVNVINDSIYIKKKDIDEMNKMLPEHLKMGYKTLFSDDRDGGLQTVRTSGVDFYRVKGYLENDKKE